MKAPHLFTGCATVALLSASASSALAVPLQVPATCLIGTAVGQTGKTKTTAEDRREVETLLGKARQAMKEGNLETADSLVTRAEALQVDFNLFHIGDTPKKVRKDLDGVKRSKKAAPRPSQQAKPVVAGESLPPKFAGEGTVDRSAKPAQIEPSDEPDQLPVLNKPDRSRDAAPFGRSTALTPEMAEAEVSEDAVVRPRAGAPSAAGLKSPAGSQPSNRAANNSPDARRQSDAHLLNARRALALGDVKRATALVEQAKALQVSYDYLDDSPAKVETIVRKYSQFSEQHNGKPDSEGARRQYADLLMEQAQQLMRWKDYDAAERLATNAMQLGVSYGPFDAKPETLLDRIASERKGIAKTPVAAATGPLPAFEKVGIAKGPTNHPAKQQAEQLMQQARLALMSGDLDKAEQLGRQAEALKVPDSAFAAREERPWMVTLEVQKARLRGAGVTVAGGKPEKSPYPTTQAIYDKDNDPTRNLIAGASQTQPDTAAESATEETPDRLPPAEDEHAKPLGDGMKYFLQGEKALRGRDTKAALENFRKAHEHHDDLDSVTRQRLQEHLSILSAPAAAARAGAASDHMLESATQKQNLLAKTVSNDIIKQQQAALKLVETDPNGALQLLNRAKSTIDNSGVEPATRAALHRRIDADLVKVQKYISDNKVQIELDATNKAIKGDIDRKQNVKLEIQDKLAQLVDQYNKLMDENRFEEAGVIAKRAQELDPENPVVVQIVRGHRLIRNNRRNNFIRDEKEDAYVNTLESVEEGLIPFDDRDPIRFPDKKKWDDLTKGRAALAAERRSRRTERELEIERKLKSPVMLKYSEKPLNEVLTTLGKLADINIYIDQQGLAQEGIDSSTPITFDLTNEIAVKSALNLILQPLNLGYVIKDEVLKVTSANARQGETYTETYMVADLVMPIPNFAPNSRMGLAGALAEAHATAGLASGFGSPIATIASKDGAPANAMVNPSVLSQIAGVPGMPGTRCGAPATGMNQPVGFGPGGMGGGVQADFDSLIELITTTIQPNTWDDVGGPGSVKEFETNLSLVISQTQEVHEQIRDLLEQLRRLQDLQVTIEVRFITLNDNFFERIGVDFDFNIDDNVNVDPTTLDDQSPSVAVGLQEPAGANVFPNFTADLDIPFRQDSFSLAVPQFGQPVPVAQFGFAILSDIEAYFLVSAAQGDRRSNVLQAPKVTLFNGQQAFVSDTSQTPFVISVIPVVGDFAAAQQPVIVVLSEGTFLTVQAVISNDRRFVRLTVVPFFSQIGNVEEFTFSGSKTTTKNTSTETDGDDTTSETDDETVTQEGVTVQLPTFSFVTVTTTVSVPDGGTVLLGGIKRLSEGRNEFGVPILSKLPYINRLFKNVGIGRDTQSLMMMVTPRIIIQEEEEERLGIAAP